ncbi:MAG TPA: response regulator [Candidatus Limnocylindrales bacterium]|nr:response regulator [Candidatus Limnocylindrales bacterium]
MTDQPAPHDGIPAASGAVEPTRILLVDDNPDDRRLVRRALERDLPEVTIVEVFDAAGLEVALDAGAFDLVITDYGLRWSDGLVVLRGIRDRYPDRPVIMFTGTGNQEIAVEAMKAGLTDYVVKTPKQYGQLPYLVRAAFEQVRQRAAIRRLEEQLRQSQKMEALGLLAGGIAHDFNNILTIIGGHAQLLEHELAADDPRRDDVVAIRQATDRATAITRQLLAFSRRQPLRPERVELGAAIAEFASLAGRLLGPEIELVVERPEGPVEVLIDRSQLEQVFMNLAVNARDAMPEGGRLSVSAGSDGERARIVVADTGTGMTDDVLAHAFEPFYTTKEAGRGTGLGLATVYGAVDGAGGTVSVRSAPDAGSTFEIVLPLAPASESAPISTVDSAPDRTEVRPVVLLVDDEPAIRQLAGRLLERDGFEVIRGDSATAAIAIVEDPAVSIDVVLTDLVMPGVGGAELAAVVRRVRPTVPIVFMSGFAEADVVTSLDAPVVPKPFTAEVLVGAVRRALHE